jgi:hypothetical protein
MSDEEAAIRALVNRVRALENPPTKLEDEPVWLDIKQVAHRLSISERTVRRLPLRKYRPARRCIRYKVKDVDEYMNRCVEHHPVTPRKTEQRRLSPRISAYPALPTREEIQAKVRREDERKRLPHKPTR